MLQRKVPSEVQNLVNILDYKVNMDEKTKFYHASLLKQLKQEENMSAAVESQEDITGVAIIDAEPTNDSFVTEDEDMLDLRMLGVDVNRCQHQ